jgi:hypothetical protein
MVATGREGFSGITSFSLTAPGAQEKRKKPTNRVIKIFLNFNLLLATFYLNRGVKTSCINSAFFSSSLIDSSDSHINLMPGPGIILASMWSVGTSIRRLG